MAERSRARPGRPSRAASTGSRSPRTHPPASEAAPRTAAGRLVAVAAGQGERRSELILARNWRTPLVVDVVLGAIVLVVGLGLAIGWSPLPGGGIGALGALYALLAVRRWRRWAEVRRQAGLDG